MPGLMKKIDMFCYRHPRFGVRNLMLIIVIGTAAVWLLSMMDRSGQLLGLLSFSPTAILHGQIWRLVTFVFVPTNSGIWLLISLYFYYFVGSVLEREWGAGRFTIFYLSGMLLTIVYGFIVYFAAGLPVPLSTVYINYSLFFAFATLYPDNMVLLFFFIPLKMKWLAWLDAAYFAYSILDGLISLPGTGHRHFELPALFRQHAGRPVPPPRCAAQNGELPAGAAPHEEGRKAEKLHAQVRRLRPHGRGLPGA